MRYSIAQEVLPNGGFEQGLNGWSVAGGSLSGDCDPRSGSDVMNISGGGPSPVVVRSSELSVSAGSIAVEGYARILEGEPDVSVMVQATGTSGAVLPVKKD